MVIEYRRAALLALLVVCRILTIQARSMNRRNLENLERDLVVPDVINRKPEDSIRVVYPSGVTVQQGNELTPTLVKDEPRFMYASQIDKLYTLAMIDPDASSREDPTKREHILHMLVINIPGNDLTKGDILAEYIGSGPPKDSGFHRYVFLLYRQNEKITSNMKISRNSFDGRRQFSIQDFASANKLSDPIGANFYKAQYDDYVPKLYSQFELNKTP